MNAFKVKLCFKMSYPNSSLSKKYLKRLQYTENGLEKSTIQNNNVTKFSKTW